jgi:hypothetical protein
VLRRLDIAAQLPTGRLARVAVLAALFVGAIVAAALTALILVFLVTALRR